MSSNLNPQKALIFRIVHRDNLPWLLEHGLYAKNGAKRDPDFTSIGNSELIQKRTYRKVPIPPAGTLSDYVPFYFTPFSMMLYNIKTGYGGIRHVPDNEIAFVVSSLYRIQELGIPFVFTDEHAYLATAGFYNRLSDLDRIDWPILQRRDFKHDPDNDPGKTDRYQAEALIWQHVPLEALLGVCCYNEGVRTEVQAHADRHNVKVRVSTQTNWYFS